MTLQYCMTKYIIYILFTVVCFAQKQSISTYILGNILAPVVYFAELVKTGLWTICVEQHALHTFAIIALMWKLSSKVFMESETINRFPSRKNEVEEL